MNAALFVLNWNKKKEKKEKGAATFRQISAASSARRSEAESAH